MTDSTELDVAIDLRLPADAAAAVQQALQQIGDAELPTPVGAPRTPALPAEGATPGGK